MITLLGKMINKKWKCIDFIRTTAVINLNLSKLSLIKISSNIGSRTKGNNTNIVNGNHIIFKITGLIILNLVKITLV